MSKHSYVVMVPFSWGRGPTLAEAAKNCLAAGGNRTDRAAAFLVVGDEHPAINGMGDLVRDEGSERFDLGMFKLGALLRCEFKKPIDRVPIPAETKPMIHVHAPGVSAKLTAAELAQCIIAAEQEKESQ